MDLIRDCDHPGESLIPLTANERNGIWNECMTECDGYLSRADFDRIIKEVYGEIPSPISKTDSESSSSSFFGYSEGESGIFD